MSSYLSCWMGPQCKVENDKSQCREWLERSSFPDFWKLSVVIFHKKRFTVSKPDKYPLPMCQWPDLNRLSDHTLTYNEHLDTNTWLTTCMWGAPYGKHIKIHYLYLLCEIVQLSPRDTHPLCDERCPHLVTKLTQSNCILGFTWHLHLHSTND